VALLQHDDAADTGVWQWSSLAFGPTGSDSGESLPPQRFWAIPAAKAVLFGRQQRVQQPGQHEAEQQVRRRLEHQQPTLPQNLKQRMHSESFTAEIAEE